MMRDRIETLVRAWDAHERARGASRIIDFDYRPLDEPVAPASSRLDVLTGMTRLLAEAVSSPDSEVATDALAHVTYVSAQLGERLAFETYVQRTQGCSGAGWPDEYVSAVGDVARRALADLDVGWDDQTEETMTVTEGRLPADLAIDAVLAAAAELEPVVRRLTGTSAPYHLEAESVDVDEYWSYWLSGEGSRQRLRLNRRRAVFTEVRARQFALHEILGHALQAASLARVARDGAVPWSRLSCVHDPRQVHFEGLATALPLFAAPDDTAVVARVRLDHYLHLVRAELHRAVNDGVGLGECAALARQRVPFWTDATISDVLADRGADPLLRSYLWAYPAGTDWFVNLADHADAPTIERVLRASYERPLTPADLTALWPAGPGIGGSGAAVRVRQPALP